MPRLTDAQWEQVREDWHSDVLTNDEICEKYDISLGTLRQHAKNPNHGWLYPRDRAKAAGAGDRHVEHVSTATVTLGEPAVIEYEPPAPHDFGAPTDHDQALSEGDLAALLHEERQRRIAAEARTAELEKEAAKLRPYVEVDMYETVDDVIRIIGEPRLKDMVAEQYARLNQQRRLEGKELYVLDGEEQQAKMREIAQELLDERYKAEDENPHRTRVLKMVSPQGNLVQIIAEDQANNMRGSRGDWYTRYTDRGFKILVDRRSGATVCGSLNCWRVAAKDERGNFTQLGYCSEGHRRWVEGNKPQSPVLQPVGANVTGEEVSRTGLTRVG